MKHTIIKLVTTKVWSTYNVDSSTSLSTDPAAIVQAQDPVSSKEESSIQYLCFKYKEEGDTQCQNQR